MRKVFPAPAAKSISCCLYQELTDPLTAQQIRRSTVEPILINTTLQEPGSRLFNSLLSYSFMSAAEVAGRNPLQYLASLFCKPFSNDQPQPVPSRSLLAESVHISKTILTGTRYLRLFDVRFEFCHQSVVLLLQCVVIVGCNNRSVQNEKNEQKHAPLKCVQCQSKCGFISFEF